MAKSKSKSASARARGAVSDVQAGGSARANGPTRFAPQQVSVLIVGAGISGIGAAIRVRAEGIDDVVVLEKADDLGGTWRDNTYPGCACDVPSSLYSYSFAQKPDWTRVFAAQPEILRYVRATAEHFDVRKLIRFGEGVERATWREDLERWVVATSRSEYHARVVISCAGYLHEPQIPKLPGIESFPGTVFHSSRWLHEHSLRDERVAVIGTGASAIQFVPQIQAEVRSLALFQRTPQWILPKPDAALGELPRRVLGLRGATGALRQTLYHGFETLGAGFRHPELMRSAEVLAKAHLRRAVRDRVLREKLTPDYVLGCKRVLLSNDYYPSLTKPNVEVFATGVTQVRGRSVVGSDGQAREVDTIIFGTGFHVSDPPMAGRVFGAHGRSLAEVWAGSPEAHRGTAVNGFPNSFMVLGPNLAIGHNSAFIVIEAQLDYVIDALRTMRARGLTRVEVRPEAQTAYNQKVQRDLAGTVWNTGGCSSYYIDANGKNSIGFPWSTHTMRRLLRRFDLENYRTQAAETAWLPPAREPLHAD